MSLPVVLPSPCPVVAGAAGGELPLRCRGRLAPGALPLIPGRQAVPSPLYGRSLFALGLLQIALGFSVVSLSFGALSLTESPNVRNSCPFWAGSSVILSGILGLTTWKRPMLLLVKIVEGSSCFCCEDSQATKCSNKKEILILYPVLSVTCDTVRLVLKDLLFAICVLNALTTTVCVVAAALQYLQIFAGRRPQTIEAQIPQEEFDVTQQIPDPDEFVPPTPPPPYFSTFCSYSPRINPRILSNDVIPLTHIYASRMKGIEVFCPVEPPPPYEAVARDQNDEQVSSLLNARTEADLERTSCAAPDDSNVPSCSLSDPLQLCIVHPAWSRNSEAAGRKSSKSGLRRSNSDPVLLELVIEELVVSCEAATQTDERSEEQAVTLRRGRRSRGPRSRPKSLVDYTSYRDTKLLVASFLKHSSCSMTPEVQELVDNIRSVLQSDEEHMEEAVASANILDQAITGNLQRTIPRRGAAQTRGRTRLLHLRSCGDLSTCTVGEWRPGARGRELKGQQERPHSLIGVIQETML
ncbi:endosomal transmembrane epsin interactor 1 isoform X4 [Rhinoraja longicauda]